MNAAGRRVGRRWTAGLLLLIPLAHACVQTQRPLPSFAAGLDEARPKVEVQLFDPSGQPVSGVLDVTADPGNEILGLRRAPWAARPASGPARQDGQEGQAAPEPGEEGFDDPFEDADLYARFGRQIVKNPDGTLTKPYYVDAPTQIVLEKLLELAKGSRVGQAGEGFDGLYQFGKDPKNPGTVFDRLLAGYSLLIQTVKDFDQIPSFAFQGRNWNGQIPGVNPSIKNTLVLVTSEPDGLEAFEQAMELFYNAVPQILIQASVVEFSTEDTLDLGVTQAADQPTLRTVGKGSFVKEIISKFPNTSTAGAGDAATSSEGLLTLGGIHDNLELNATLELLMTRGKSDIISNPRIAVRNGGMAVINTTSKVPYPSAQIQGTTIKTTIKFENVGVTMMIRPFVTPGDAVHLQFSVEVSAITGFSDTDPIPTPIISTRGSTTHVIVPNGKSAVIGGLLTKTRFENEAKIPLLGDIPVLGYLFRSTFVQSSYNEVIFILTPRVLESWPSVDEDMGGVGF